MRRFSNRSGIGIPGEKGFATPAETPTIANAVTATGMRIDTATMTALMIAHIMTGATGGKGTEWADTMRSGTVAAVMTIGTIVVGTTVERIGATTGATTGAMTVATANVRESIRVAGTRAQIGRHKWAIVVSREATTNNGRKSALGSGGASETGTRLIRRMGTALGPHLARTALSLTPSPLQSTLQAPHHTIAQRESDSSMRMTVLLLRGAIPARLV